jgi:hypothetical protein
VNGNKDGTLSTSSAEIFGIMTERGEKTLDGMKARNISGTQSYNKKNSMV